MTWQNSSQIKIKNSYIFTEYVSEMKIATMSDQLPWRYDIHLRTITSKPICNCLLRSNVHNKTVS